MNNLQAALNDYWGGGGGESIFSNLFKHLLLLQASSFPAPIAPISLTCGRRGFYKPKGLLWGWEMQMSFFKIFFLAGILFPASHVCHQLHHIR